jgi:hypothetical protein
MSNNILADLFKPSMEDIEETDRIIEEIANDQIDDTVTDQQANDEIEHVENDIDTLDKAKALVEGDDVSMEQLAVAQGIVNAIGMRYGAIDQEISMENLNEFSGVDKDRLVEQITTYRNGLDDKVTASLEGFFVAGRTLNGLGKDLAIMKKVIAVMKSEDIEKVKTLNLGPIKQFIRIGGGVPDDLPKAINGVSSGLELTMKHADHVLSTAQRAADIAIKTNWNDVGAADKAREQIRSLKLNLDQIGQDLNGYPMFGNRSFGVKIKGESGSLGEWNKKYSFGAGTPNLGLIRSTLFAVGVVGALFVSLLGGAIVVAISLAGGKKREIPLKSLATSLEGYLRSAEKVYGQRTNSIKKSTVHKKLIEDLKNVNHLPKDVRKSIARASAFGWSMTNGVYHVVSHSARALAMAGAGAAFS